MFFLVVALPLVLEVRWWYVLTQLGVWLAGLVVGLRWFTRRPYALVPLAAGLALAWFVSVLLGARAGWLG